MHPHVKHMIASRDLAAIDQSVDAVPRQLDAAAMPRTVSSLDPGSAPVRAIGRCVLEAACPCVAVDCIRGAIAVVARVSQTSATIGEAIPIRRPELIVAPRAD
jgi:hypothetical protein